MKMKKLFLTLFFLSAASAHASHVREEISNRRVGNSLPTIITQHITKHGG